MDRKLAAPLLGGMTRQRISMFRRSKLLSTCTVLFLLLGAPLLVLGCSSDASPIVFNSDLDGNMDIYSIGADGAGLTNLTNSPQDESSPMVSPNGKLISFLSESNGASTMELMPIDGSDRQRITPHEGTYHSQRWSPTSDRLAYAFEQADRSLVYVATTNGEEPELLSRKTGNEVGGWSWSGDQVTFVVDQGDGQGIYIRNADGVNEHRVTDTPDYSPVWSPDDHTIAFLSTRDGNAELYVIDATGSNQRRITETDADEYHISWSPNGKLILFVSERDGNAEVYVTDSDGEEQTRLTFSTDPDEQPTWSPNGKRIAFVSYVDGDAEIIVMKSDGSNQVRLTNNEADDTGPSW